MSDDRFYQSQSHEHEPDTPSVEPLRINKTGSPPQSQGGRYKFSADDPNRPTISGYASSISPPPARNAPYPKSLPESPGPEAPEKDDFGPAYPATRSASPGDSMPVPENFMPRPIDTTESHLGVSNDNLTRAGTQASAHTTRAERGSPPPPETPLQGPPVPPLPFEDHTQASGYAMHPGPNPNIGPSVSTNPYRQSQQIFTPPSSNDGQNPRDEALQQQQQPKQDSKDNVLSGKAIQGLNLQDEPPPAYTTMPQAGFPDGIEKRQGASAIVNAMDKVEHQPPDLRAHPAFANPAPSTTLPSHPAAAALAPVRTEYYREPIVPPAPAIPTSPPPMPEGWISHLDQNSGQYYYIHLPTQSTQWEFPKGPTPLAMQEPTTPMGYAASVHSPGYNKFAGSQLGSPGYPSPGLQSQFATYGDSMSMVGVSSPTASVFTGPPPSAGVEMFKVMPSNGVYFGPYLRYTNLDLERNLWLGSILIITDSPMPPTIHIHQSIDLSPNPRQLKANPIFSHRRYLFYRYDIDILMEEHPTRWLYAITSHLGCTRYEFVVAGRYETNWRFITHSGNDFAVSVNANERARLGGVGIMWKDVLQRHQECGGFHAQIGLGGQISADRLWHDVPMLKQWTTLSGKDNRKNAPWSPKLEDDVVHAFFHYYTSHFDQPHLREGIAQIPNIFALDDHDIFDGFGSYPDYMQQSHMFKNIGRIGIDMYLLFQHHTTYEILRNVRGDLDLFTITGHGWHYIKFLGPAVVVVGPDTRSERTVTQVLAGPTYQGLFPKIATLPPCVQHCLWIFPVPLIYPRLHSANQIANTVSQGKKAVTGTFNMLGKVTSSVAGIVGAKDVINEGFQSVKKAVGKSGLMSGMLSPFGEFDVLDELRDMWTHDSKDLERTYIIRTLQGISHNKSVRMTFLSGSVNCAGAGLVHDPQHPSDHKTMYQLISSAIVNAPPSSMVLRMLNTDPKQPIYVPLNGQRTRYSTTQPMPITDSKEDMMEIFIADPDGRPREMKRLMGRRNYLAMVVYDPDFVSGGGYGQTGHHRSGSLGRPNSPSPSAYSGTTAFTEQRHESRLSLGADFIVQSGEGGYGGSVKYGPVAIPSLEYGR